MHNSYVQTLMITTRCAGQCRPCPFAGGKLTQRFLGTQDVVAAVQSSLARLVVITGGEPLEHPHFHDIVRALQRTPRQSGSASFRVATGGHIPLQTFIEDLKECDRFVGFSIGTDVISKACTMRASHTKIWKENITALNSVGLAYSLTLTLHPAEDHLAQTNLNAVCAPLRAAARFGARPKFIYLRHGHAEKKLDALGNLIAKLFQNTEIIYDSI
jgi:MoaA/NifB/PqqE/SkfB family radical SAM enzyme